MSNSLTKISGAPFDLLTFNLVPADVANFFDVDQDFQRETRSTTPMIAGIQATLAATHVLVRPIDVCRSPEDDRLIVIDGKHRLHALATMPQKIRCTIYALCYRVTGREEMIALFEAFNLTVPPHLFHLLRLDADRGDPTLKLLREKIPFIPSFDDNRSHRTVGLSITKVLHWFTRAFSDVPRFSRFTKNEVLRAVTPAHVEQLAAFYRIFLNSKPPAMNETIQLRWCEALFRVYVQNPNLLSEQDWVRRIHNMFNDRRTQRCLDDPVITMQTKAFRALVIYALNEPRAPKIVFNPDSAPSISDLQSSRAVDTRGAIEKRKAG